MVVVESQPPGLQASSYSCCRPCLLSQKGKKLVAHSRPQVAGTLAPSPQPPLAQHVVVTALICTTAHATATAGAQQRGGSARMIHAAAREFVHTGTHSSFRDRRLPGPPHRPSTKKRRRDGAVGCIAVL